MHDLTIMCHEISELYYKEKKTNMNEKKASCKTQSSYILLAYLFIDISLLIVVSNFCYLIKC